MEIMFSKGWGINEEGIIYKKSKKTFSYEYVIRLEKEPNKTVVRLSNGSYLMLKYNSNETEEALKAFEYIEERIKANIIQDDSELEDDSIFNLIGARGRSLRVYDDRIVLENRVTFGSMIAGTCNDGRKTIFYNDIIAVQMKAAGLVLGYIQFETAASTVGKDKFFNDNTFTYEEGSFPYANTTAKEVVEFVERKIAEIKLSSNGTKSVQQISPADELLKYKQLLDMGAISQNEYDMKKKQLLGM